VRRQGQLAVAVDAQAFALDPVQALAEQGQVGVLGQQCQTMGEKIAQGVDSFTDSRANMGGRLGGFKRQTTRKSAGLPRFGRYYRQAKVAWALAISLSP
jgi:hypothetical protein